MRLGFFEKGTPVNSSALSEFRQGSSGISASPRPSQGRGGAFLAHEPRCQTLETSVHGEEDLVQASPYGYDGYMKKATVAHVKNNLSRYLAYVSRGGRVTIFNRDTPVAELVPVRAASSSNGGDLEMH